MSQFATRSAADDELLARVQQGTANDNSEHQQRLNQFRQQAAEQDRLLQEARTRRANEEARSEHNIFSAGWTNKITKGLDTRVIVA